MGNGKSKEDISTSQAAEQEETIAKEISDIEETEKQLAAMQQDIALYKDQLLRKSADFENFRKRVERDKAQWVAYANEKLLLDLLPVVDDLERSLAAGKESHQNDSFYDGVQLIYQKFLKTLEAAGVQPMKTIGEELNVEFHEALMQTPREDVAPNTIVDEAQRGYLLNGKVLRHARVVVASAPKES